MEKGVQINLDSQVFKDTIDKKLFYEMLQDLTNITPEFISREEFNNKKGEFLEANGENEIGKKHTLYLPDDIKIYEIPAIILRINKLTFGDTLPEYASTKELQIKIVLAIETLLPLLEGENDDKEVKEIKKAIKKYYLLYSQLFGEEEAQKLNGSTYRKSILTQKDNEKYAEYRRKLINIETKEALSNLEELVSREILHHLDETFYEEGGNMLRLGMETITGVEQEEEVDYKEGKIYKHIKSAYLDEEARLLREKIGIAELKQELEDARKEGNSEKIAQAEMKATNRILEVIYEYPYQLTESDNGYRPRTILESKELYCVGFSMLGSAFLTELGIKHKGLDIPEHSALEVIIGGKRYYFDATNKNELNELVYDGEKSGSYEVVKVLGKEKLVYSGNPERILLSHYYNNKGVWLSNLGDIKTEEALKMFNKAIELNPNSYLNYSNKGSLLEKLGRDEEALEMFNKAIELNPNNYETYKYTGSLLEKLGRNEEALEMFNKAIELNPDDYDSYRNMGSLLEKLGKYAQSVDMYMKYIEEGRKTLRRYSYFSSGDVYKDVLKICNIAIKSEPDNYKSYFNKAILLSKLFSKELADIYAYVYISTEGKDKYRVEIPDENKRKIDDYIKKEDFEGLRLYMLELEEKN